MDSLPGNVSGGPKQRVAADRALVGNPEIIFADEPTAAMDGETGREVVLLLRHLARIRQTSILIVSHDNRILDLTDRIIAKDGSQIVDVERTN